MLLRNYNPFALPRLLPEPAYDIDAEAAADGAVPGSGSDRGPLVAFVVAALALTAMEAVTGPRALATLLRTLHEAVPDQVPAYAAVKANRWYPALDIGLWVATRALAF